MNRLKAMAAARSEGRLRGRVEQRGPSVLCVYAVDEWLRASGIEESTRDGYVNYIGRYIKPVLGELLVRRSMRTR